MIKEILVSFLIQWCNFSGSITPTSYIKSKENQFSVLGFLITFQDHLQLAFRWIFAAER